MLIYKFINLQIVTLVHNLTFALPIDVTRACVSHKDDPQQVPFRLIRNFFICLFVCLVVDIVLVCSWNAWENINGKHNEQTRINHDDNNYKKSNFVRLTRHRIIWKFCWFVLVVFSSSRSFLLWRRRISLCYMKKGLSTLEDYSWCWCCCCYRFTGLWNSTRFDCTCPIGFRYVPFVHWFVCIQLKTVY